MDDLDKLKADLSAQIAAADLAALDAGRIDALGRNGRVTQMLKGLGQMDGEARKTAGQALNVLKNEIGATLDARKANSKPKSLGARPSAIFCTLPLLTSIR